MLQIWFIDKAFEGSNIYTVEDIPDDIDVMVLSHDHWDHLDYDMVRKIEPKVRCVVTGLDNGGYYEKWGYPPEKIREEDWDTEVVIDKDLSSGCCRQSISAVGCCPATRRFLPASLLLPRTEKCITPATAGMMDVLKGSGSSSAVLIWHWWKTDNTMKLGTACI